MNRADGELLDIVYSSPVPNLSENDADISNNNAVDSPTNGLDSFNDVVWNETFQEGNRQFVIHAKFEYADLDCPIYLAEKGFFDIDRANAIAKVVAPNAIRMRDMSLTKDEIKSNLEAAIRGRWIDNGSGEGYFGSYEGQEEEIAYWSELWKNADDSSAWSDLRPIDSIPAKVRYLCEDDKTVHLSVQERNISCGLNTSIYAVVQPESWVLNGGAMLNEPAGTTIEKPIISMYDAQEIANEMVNALNANHLKMASCEKARMVDGMTAEKISTGWQITFTFAEGAYLAVDYTQIKESYVLSKDESYSIPWNMEYIMIYVDDNGIKRIYWNEPAIAFGSQRCVFGGTAGR